MNKQILKLFMQACRHADYEHQNVPKELVDKFAELIVRECANMLDEDSYLMPELGGYAHDIRKRFGVEE